MALSELAPGQSAIVVALDLPHEIQDHLMHLGFSPEASIQTLRRAPAGDPTVYRVEGMEIALRRETARHIAIRAPIHAEATDADATPSDGAPEDQP
ncbi:MAG: FeoA family protein [Acidobacteriaceae bacterium]